MEDECKELGTLAFEKAIEILKKTALTKENVNAVEVLAEIGLACKYNCRLNSRKSCRYLISESKPSEDEIAKLKARKEWLDNLPIKEL
ncbi:MAG: hypothetical protein LUD81_07945 [Clostridiales bacterium]|nr:hypothetical protein [Clostridiales bacterium]